MAVKGSLESFLVAKPTLFLSLMLSTMGLILSSPVTEDVSDSLDTPDALRAYSSWYCPEKWISYVGFSESSCFYIERSTSNFYNARTNCERLGASLAAPVTKQKRDFVSDLAQKARLGSNYWIGLYKRPGTLEFYWVLRNGSTLANNNILPSEITGSGGYNEECGYIADRRYNLLKTDCNNQFVSICEQEVATCKPGTFGKNCARSCHCAGEQCTRKTVRGQEVLMCKDGCQGNWTGIACDIEKQTPEVKYYCINSKEEKEKYIYIRIYTKGVRYRSIYGLNSNKIKRFWCPFTVAKTHNTNLTTIKVSITPLSIEKMSTGECPGQQVDEETFTMAMILKEKDGILSEHDLQMNIMCNFSAADSLVTSDQYSLEQERFHLNQKTFMPDSVQDDVHLQVSNAYSGEPVTAAATGSIVLLEMKYALQNESRLTGVIPYNCVAYSPDRKHLKQLLDEHGCPVLNSPVKSFSREDDQKIVTPWFNLFAFEEEPSVAFQCSFRLCFSTDCAVGCSSPTKHRRDTQHFKDERSHSITSTVRILPSNGTKKTTGDSQNVSYPPAYPPAAPPAYDMGLFVYVNPVTCSLFLLILLVFLCMYIAFIRTLRKSVYDIRKEIEVRRSRDKFLSCGCVQQKDRDYVAP